jgi:hypothetical protein
MFVAETPIPTVTPAVDATVNASVPEEIVPVVDMLKPAPLKVLVLEPKLNVLTKSDQVLTRVGTPTTLLPDVAVGPRSATPISTATELDIAGAIGKLGVSVSSTYTPGLVYGAEAIVSP